jgi:hypothetical protein
VQQRKARGKLLVVLLVLAAGKGTLLLLVEQRS